MWKGKSKSFTKKIKARTLSIVKRLGEWIVVCGVVVFILIDRHILDINYGAVTTKTTLNGIYITAAHIPTKDVDSKYKLLNKDDYLDRAIYLDTTYKGPIYPNQTVNIAGMKEAQIIEASAGSFTVTVTNPEQIANGLSGTRVFTEDNSKVIGYVVELLKGGKLRCNSIE